MLNKVYLNIKFSITYPIINAACRFNSLKHPSPDNISPRFQHISTPTYRFSIVHAPTWFPSFSSGRRRLSFLYPMDQNLPAIHSQLTPPPHLSALPGYRGKVASLKSRLQLLTPQQRLISLKLFHDFHSGVFIYAEKKKISQNLLIE